MDTTHINELVMTAIGALGGIFMLIALFLLWSKSASGWLLLALAGEGISLLFRIVYALVPSALSGMPAVVMVWQGCALMVAGGLLGYAFEQSARRP